jgi:hypothetical protein
MTNSTDCWACTDCAHFIANGETPTGLDVNATDVWLDNFQRRTADGHWGWGHSHVECHHGPDEDYEERTRCETDDFSWTSCSVCGSTLGGARYGVHFAG